MADKAPHWNRRGVLTHAFGALLISGGLWGVALSLGNHTEMVGPLAIAIAICFAGIAISEAIRERS